MVKARNIFLTVAIATLPVAAQAYVGPGLGAGAVAAVLGVAGAILLALFAIVYYPVKRMLKKRKKAAGQTATSAGANAEE